MNLLLSMFVALVISAQTVNLGAVAQKALYHKEHVALQVPLADGSVLVREGELIVRPGAQTTVLLFHGFKGSKEDTRVLRMLFPESNSLIIDFRAHGGLRASAFATTKDAANMAIGSYPVASCGLRNNKNQCCSFGAQEALEVKAAVDFIKHDPTLKTTKLIGYGISMGAVSVIQAQARFGNLFDLLILDTPFDSIEAVIKRGLQQVSYKVAGYDLAKPVRNWLENNLFDPKADYALRYLLRKSAGLDASDIPTCLQPVSSLESIGAIKIPVFIIGCDSDLQVPEQAIKKLHEQITHPYSELWIAHARGHGAAFLDNPEEYATRVSNFIDQYLTCADISTNLAGNLPVNLSALAQTQTSLDTVQ